MLGRITVALFFLLLIWGNLVAGLKAGLACPGWPLCNGTVILPFRLDIWMEYTQRLIAALATILLLMLSWKRFFSYQGLAKAVPLAAAIIIGAEILLGGAVVLLELPVQLTTVHLMTGLTILLLAFYMASFNGEDSPAGFSLQGPAGLFFGMGLVVFSQSTLGAYVRHAKAGLVCPDFPTCQGSWFPHNMGGNLMAHFSHRLTAGLILVTIGMICIATFLDPGFFRYRKMLLGLLFLCLGQIAVGGLVVLSKLYFLATTLHLLIALSILVLFFHLWSIEVKQEKLS